MCVYTILVFFFLRDFIGRDLGTEFIVTTEFHTSQQKCENLFS